LSDDIVLGKLGDSILVCFVAVDDDGDTKINVCDKDNIIKIISLKNGSALILNGHYLFSHSVYDSLHYCLQLIMIKKDFLSNEIVMKSVSSYLNENRVYYPPELIEATKSSFIAFVDEDGLYNKVSLRKDDQFNKKRKRIKEFDDDVGDDDLSNTLLVNSNDLGSHFKNEFCHEVEDVFSSNQLVDDDDDDDNDFNEAFDAWLNCKGCDKCIMKQNRLKEENDDDDDVSSSKNIILNDDDDVSPSSSTEKELITDNLISNDLLANELFIAENEEHSSDEENSKTISNYLLLADKKELVANELLIAENKIANENSSSNNLIPNEDNVEKCICYSDDDDDNNNYTTDENISPDSIISKKQNRVGLFSMIKQFFNY
jgi:hypothetical protein